MARVKQNYEHKIMVVMYGISNENSYSISQQAKQRERSQQAYFEALKYI